jgi:uncharacterized protein
MDHRGSTAEVVARFGLSPHTEGGYFRETYRASSFVETPRGRRATATTILYLVDESDPSLFHRLAFDELWFFHAGGPLEMLFLQEPGAPVRSEVLDARNPQVLVPGGVWMAARVMPGHNWTLAGCVVTPGFEYEDFEEADRESLPRDYPDAAEHIARSPDRDKAGNRRTSWRKPWTSSEGDGRCGCRSIRLVRSPGSN